MRLHPITSDSRLSLGDPDARRTDALSGAKLAAATDHETARIGKLQRLLYADGRYALLIVLQGRDAAGKDGTVRHVFSAVNPQGCEVTSFGVPTELETRHDYLWRVHQRVPAHRMIGIFNRSHYEDVLVPRVHGSLSRHVLAERYDQINDFERMLVDNQVVVLKFFLHVSRAEQKRRLTERLTDETKNWKFRAGDLDDRAKWKVYTAAYRRMLQRCSPRRAPWFLVPADDKAVRNCLIARTIADALEELSLRYPPAPDAVRALEIE